ncbi:MAG: hypothetical protein Q7U07_01470 [Gammaproteobacteria bacterium]|nr:hypothetical protein [Gammaproteobacteria bacterium]
MYKSQLDKLSGFTNTTLTRSALSSEFHCARASCRVTTPDGFTSLCTMSSSSHCSPSRRALAACVATRS